MFEDGKSFVERRLSPRIKMTVRRHIAYWVAMSPARRVVASLGVAAIVGGATFGACRASDLTGPNFKSQNQQYANGSVSRSLTGDLVGGDESDSWPMEPASHNRMTPEEAEKDNGFQTSVRVSLPATEALYNPCRGELVVLNGELRRQVLIDADPNGHIRFQMREWQDARSVNGSATVEEEWDHDGNPTTPPEKRSRTVRYHNHEALMDKFQVGPAGAPF